MQNKRNRFTYLRFTVLILCLIGLLTLSKSVSARNYMFNRQSMQTVQQGTTIDGPGFFSGDFVEINGNVDGTTFASGDLIRVNGDINGSLFVLGETIQVTGEISGNIYGAGQLIQVSGDNGGDIFFAGRTVNIGQNAQIGRDVFIASMDSRLEGPIPRHLFAVGESLILNGTIGGSANVNSEELTLEDSAMIEGDLRYESPNEAIMSPNATIAGQTDFTQRDSWDGEWNITQQERWQLTLIGALWSVLSALVVWFLIKLIIPHFWKETILPIGNQPLKTMGFGLLAFLATPFLVLLLMITLIGIPMGILLAMLYGIGLYISTIIVALFIGASLFRLMGIENFNKEFFLVLFGLIILELLSLINILDWIIGIIIIIVGLGALLFSLRPSEKKEQPYYREP